MNSSTLDKLIRDVFTDNSTEYVHVARPRCDESEAVIVTIDVALRQIVELVKLPFFMFNSTKHELYLESKHLLAR